MSDNLVSLALNPRTKAEVETYFERPAPALLLIGQPGSGKTTLARAMAAGILKTSNLESYPYFLHLKRPEDKKDIPIDDVRAVLRKLRLRTPGEPGIRRVVFIEDAQLLSAEAQNALLKALEEPATDTAYILTTHSDQGVLPTISSRTQNLTIQPIGLAEAKDHYQDQRSEIEITGAWQLSQGNAGLLHSLLFDGENQPLKNAVEVAKNLLRMNSYERVLELDKLSKDKEQLSMLLWALARVLTALHRASTGKSLSQQRSLIAGRRLISKLQSALEANTSPRLVALELALNLKI